MTAPLDQYGRPTGGVTVMGAAAGYALPIKASAATVFARPSAAATSSGNSGDLAVSDAAELCVDVEVTALSGTSPTITLSWERKGADGVYYPLWTSAAIAAAPSKTSITIGPGAGVSQSVGSVGRLVWTLAGTSPSVTFSASVIRD